MLEVGVAGERADRDPVSVLAEIREVVQTADVDQRRRRRDAQLQQRQQRLAAGEELRVVPVFPEQLARMVNRFGDLVLELRRDHD